jgi:hypothetical protein
MSSLPDPSRIPDDQWEFDGFSNDGTRRHFVHWIDKEKGLGFRKTENLIEDQLLASNRESLDASYGKRFSDDAIGTRMASIPLNVFYRDFAIAPKGRRQRFRQVVAEPRSEPSLQDIQRARLMLINTVSASFTRPSDTTAYASGDLVANSTTAGSVTPLTLTLTNPAQVQTNIVRCRLSKSGTTPTNANFRVHLYTASPTVANGDNGAWSSSKAANYLGYIDVASMLAFTDGCTGFAGVTAGAEMRINCNGVLYAQLEAKAAYTPVSAEVFTLYVECADNY